MRGPHTVIVRIDDPVAIAIGARVRRHTRRTERLPPQDVIRCIDSAVAIVIAKQRRNCILGN
jgi:hypothetical protein